MKANNDHIDNKLRQLENQSLPDLSRQDDHWQQMKTMLQPPVTPAKGNSFGFKNYFWWLAAILLIGGIYLIYQLTNQPGETIKPVTEKGSQPLTIKPQPIDSTPGQQSRIKDSGVSFKKQRTPLLLTARTTDGKDTTLEFLPVNESVITKEEKKITLYDFFKELEKETQQFVIDPKRDTLIAGKDGTALFIAANIFNSKSPVTILLREYYSYKDIITNRLSTCSDGRQLITGGMIHLFAMSDGKQVNLNPGKTIQWFVPDTSANMREMELFSGQPQINLRLKADTVRSIMYLDSLYTEPYDAINWVPQQRYFSMPDYRPMARVLDLRDDPFKRKITRNNELIGYFRIARDAEINKEQLRALLKEKYAYHQVVIRRERKSHIRKNKLRGTNYKEWSYAESLGDSTWVDLHIATRYKLPASDTSKPSKQNTFWDGFRWRPVSDSFSAGNYWNALSKRFSVSINTLGWINCDKFYNDQRPKIEFYVDLKDTAANYYTLLVFDRIKSMMTGSVSRAGNRVVFQNVPEGEPARVISVGIKDGKAVSAMENVQLSRTVLSGLKFEETTPADFKEQAGTMDR